MIIKIFELNKINLSDKKFFLFYGENNGYKNETIRFIMKDSYGTATDHLKEVGIIKNNSNIKTNDLEVKATKASKICDIVIKDNNWNQANWKFLSIDVEGIDEVIIKDLDIIKLSPDVIAIEYFIPKKISFINKLDYIVDSDLIRYLKEKGFALQSISGPTLILVRIKSKQTA